MLDTFSISPLKAGLTADKTARYSATGTVVTVAACNQDFTAWQESNHGQYVSIVAPGQYIRSSGYTDDFAFGTDSGTSFAAAFVAGTMAIMVGFESIQNDADGVYARLQQNVLSNAVSGFPAGTVNNLVNTGINNPYKYAIQPYLGAPGRELRVLAKVEDDAAAASSTVLPGATTTLDYCKLSPFPLRLKYKEPN
jgi:subtilisin family serine protease